MADSHIQQCIEWLDWYSQQYGTSQKDPAAFVRLIRATADYLNWMKSVNYSLATQHLHRRQLELFLDFVKNRRLHWQQLFTVNTREHFKKISGLATTAAINGLSRYLVEQGQIKTSLPQHPQQRKLTGTFRPRCHSIHSKENLPAHLKTICSSGKTAIRQTPTS
jgi:hypothetical protein